MYHRSVSSFFLLLALPHYLKAAEPSDCTANSLSLFAYLDYGKAYMKYYTYVMNQCYTEEVNEICSWSNMTKGTTSYWNFTVNVEKANENEIVKDLKIECKNAGGTVVDATYGVEMHLNSNNFTYYEEMGLEPSTFYVLNFSVTDDIVCVSPTACECISDVGDYIKYGWVVVTGADIYNLTLHNVTRENSTSFTC
jgi:hypothetical protein